MVNLGHEVSVYYLTESKGLSFPCRTEKISWNGLRCIIESDIVHSHSLRPDLLGWALKHIYRSKSIYVSTIHNYVEIDLRMEYGRIVSAVFSFLWRIAWRGLDARVVLSQHAQRYYRESFPPVLAHVVYNARSMFKPQKVNQSDSEAILSLKSKYRIIGANAAVVQRKGLMQIIESLPFLPNFAFVLAGEGPELNALIGRAQELGVSSRFLSLGFRSNARDYLSFYDIFAMPSFSEGMPLAMLEAVEAEVPVVCSKIPIFEEIFSPDEIGFFSLNHIGELVKELNAPESVLRARSMRAKTRATKMYSSDSMASEYIRIYKDGLKRE